MKFFLIAFAVIAAVAADVSHLPSNEYLPPVQQQVVPVAAPTTEYLPPVQAAAPAHVLADDGYRYKTQRRVVVRRNRRDVSHLPSSEYLPPVQESVPVEQVVSAVEEATPAHELADDGYRYKTHRRVVVRRNRRDVSHLPSSEYLPPVQQSVPVVVPTNEYLPPVQNVAPAHELADDGYRYKTHRRVVVRRNRRDVSHLPSSEYLPPVQQSVPVAVPTNEYLPPVQNVAPAHELADDGYRYKTHRRVVVRRNRRDVSHLPSSEYLPPVQQSVPVAVPTNEYLPPVQNVAPAHELADDGYRYKTHRRVVVRRNRRDVSHLPSNEYLPPVEEAPVVVNVVEEAAPAHELADDGYRYKTHRRVVVRRNRRDVSHLPSNEYLPPVQESAPVQQAEEVAVAVEEAAPAHELADDGYHYKTHRRVVYRRNRRDVSHLPSNEYLPPVEEAPVVNVVEEAAPAHELADDGYRYKTHRRVVVRRNRRDVSHLPSNEYLPPVQQQQAVPTTEYLPPVQEAVPAHELSSDGYRYKTQRRVVYRRH